MSTSSNEHVSLEDARTLLVDLVSIPSPTREERKAAKRLVEFFESHDREVWIDAVGNVRAPGDPFYDSMASTVEGAMIAFGLLGLVGLIAIFAWTWSEVQSF